MVTTLRLQKCNLRHACEARTFYTPQLERKCQKKIKGYWLLILVIRIRNNIPIFTKGSFNNQ